MEKAVTYEEFLSGILPGNYFLTKSMEIAKIKTSGTLWYTKKFLVYYYYVFLAGNITSASDVEEIRSIFDDYIESMPEALRDTAGRFFYASSPFADLRSGSFRFFDEFAGAGRGRDEAQRIEMAKKYYFAFLMGSGGQDGVNEYIKKKIYEGGFCFLQIDELIRNYFGKTAFNLARVKNDYMSFLRNERQILFYYGFVHSRSYVKNKSEFSSLTPVGELALKSNFYELIALWEHQKMKMISQPVTVDIQKITGLHADGNKFSINSNPYLSILLWLKAKNSLSDDEYKFIVSRLDFPLTPASVRTLSSDMEGIKKVVQDFDRAGDNGMEDFQKELKKYLLGIRCDFQADRNSNPIGLCKKRGHGFDVVNSAWLDNLTAVYGKLAEYKTCRYEELFNRCEQELRRQYCEKLEGLKYHLDPKIKIDWDMYNMHIDRVVFLGVLVAMAKCVLGKELTELSIMDYVAYISRVFKNAMRFLGISAGNLKKELKTLIYCFENSDYAVYMAADVPGYVALTSAYIHESIHDIEDRMIRESARRTKRKEGERTRNTTLIQLMKAYNRKAFAHEGELVCECCGGATFTTAKNESYLEYHHLIPFSSSDGPDHYLNIYALCPTCHRKIHYIRLADKRRIYHQLSENNYRRLSIVDRLIDLFRSKLLRSYQLEFLLADRAITEEEYFRILH